MEQKKCFIKYPVLLVVIVLVILGLRIAYVRGDIGMSEQAMIRGYEDYAADGYISRSDIGSSMAVFLQFNTKEQGANCDVYVRRDNAIGWFARYAATSAGWQKYVEKLTLEENGEYVLLNRSDLRISCIEIDKGNNTFTTITPEADRPFAYVMDRSWEVTVYDADGNILIPVEEKM